MKDLKLSYNDISSLLKDISCIKPEKLTSDSFKISSENQTLSTFSIVMTAQLGKIAIDQLVIQNNDLKNHIKTLESSKK